MEIVKYTEADLPGMLKIWNEVVEAGQAFPQEIAEDMESGRRFFASQSWCGVAKDASDGHIAGLYILHPNNVGRCGHICNASYAVEGGERGCGIGAMLVRDSLARARELGFRIMQFNAVAADNTAANRLYTRLGFRRLGTIEGGFRRPGDEFVSINLYCKDLWEPENTEAGQ